MMRFMDMLGVFAQGGPKTLWLPEQASEGAYNVDNAFYFVYWVSVFFFVLITVLLIWFVIKYRKPKGSQPESTVTHNTTLEVTWSVIPTILVVIMFLWGFSGFMDLANPPENCYTIQTTGQKWKWLFTYPNGHVDTELHVPADTDVKLLITSEDVLHSVFIPAFRVKNDAVPGRFTHVWFNAIKPGTYDFYCTEYCGTDHSRMITKCVVHPKDEFETWLENADPIKRMTEEQFKEYEKDPVAFIKNNPDFKGLLPPVAMGQALYDKFGCKSCHLLTEEKLIGPGFKGVFGGSRKFTDGSTLASADENYLRESILVPQAKIVEGYDGSMPSFQGRLTDRHIYCIIEFLKGLK